LLHNINFSWVFSLLTKTRLKSVLRNTAYQSRTLQLYVTRAVYAVYVREMCAGQEVTASAGWFQRLCRLRSETLPIFDRCDKRLNHLGIDEVAAKLIQLRQPEIIAGVI